MSQDQFINRHLGTDEHALAEMLSVIGVSSVEELMEQVIPHSIRIKKIADLPETGMSEAEFAEHIRQIAAKNKIFRSLIGMGYYRTAVPASSPVMCSRTLRGTPPTPPIRQKSHRDVWRPC